jgi:5-methyltetrahydropteroyltriglutamate--homocysteine methyltransferase
VSPLPLFPTSLVGSFAQPDWLIDRGKLAGKVPRVRAAELWRIAPDLLAEAQDDATRVAVRSQEEAGLDIVTDGEIRRESYSNHFATALAGVDLDNPGSVPNRSGGEPVAVPRITGPIRRPHPVQVEDLRFLRAHTDRTIKITVPGPFTMSQQAQNDHYPDVEAAAHDYAAAVNAEVRDLFAAGADIVQLDEPWLQARPEAARAYGVDVLNAALEGITGTTAVHLCFGYASIVHDRPEGYSFLPELAACACDQISIETAQSGLDLGVLSDLSGKTIILGAIDLSTPEVETAEVVAARVRRAFDRVPPERLVIAPDCGMKYLPRDSAEGKLRAMSGAARILRAEVE